MSEVNFNTGTPTQGAGNPAPAADPQAGAPAQPNPGTANEPTDGGFIEYNGRQLSKEEVAKKLEHADQFIETLKNERQEDRQRLENIEQKLGSAGKLEEVLDALRGNQPAQSGQEEPKNSPALSADELASEVLNKVQSGLAQSEIEKQREANWESVTKTLTASFGDETNAKVRQVATEYGMNMEEAAELAHTRPKVFLAMFGDKVKPSSSSTPLSSSTRNTASFAQPTPATPQKTGYADARKTSDQVAIYEKALAAKLNQL